MSRLEDITYPLDEAAYLAGVDPVAARNWIDRDRLFAGAGPGKGITRYYDVRQVFALAAIRALVDEVGLTARRAVEAVAPFSVYAGFIEGRPFALTRNADGRWIPVTGGGRCAEIHILTWSLWQEMRPRFAERYPAATVDHDRAIARLPWMAR
jgi:hypothetical protein